MSKFETCMTFFFLGGVAGALLTGAITAQDQKGRADTCRALAAIGVKAGDNITIYGDMPTWKIACLMGDGNDE